MCKQALTYVDYKLISFFPLFSNDYFLLLFLYFPCKASNSSLESIVRAKSKGERSAIKEIIKSFYRHNVCSGKKRISRYG